jgi:YesN/AraC family two-component response regulator
MQNTKKKILVVDDEEHTRLGYGEILKLADYEVDLAEDGTEGIELFKKNEYDLVISDLRMPKMGGIEFIKSLKNYDPDAKVIVITAFGSFKSYSD